MVKNSSGLTWDDKGKMTSYSISYIGGKGRIKLGTSSVKNHLEV